MAMETPIEGSTEDDDSLCLISLWAEWQHHGRLTSKLGTSRYASWMPGRSGCLQNLWEMMCAYGVFHGHGGTPKWLVMIGLEGKILMRGVPLFQETSIYMFALLYMV